METDIRHTYNIGEKKRDASHINEYAQKDLGRDQSETSVTQVVDFAAEALLSLSSNIKFDNEFTLCPYSKILKIDKGGVQSVGYENEGMKNVKDKSRGILSGPGLQTRHRPCAQLAKIENHAPSKTKANKGTGRELRFCFEKGVSGYQIFFPNPPEDAEIVMRFVRYCKAGKNSPQEDFTQKDFMKFVEIFNKKEQNTRHSTTLLNVASFLTCYSDQIFDFADKNDCDIEELLVWLKDLQKLGRKQTLICAKCRDAFLRKCENRVKAPT